MDQRIYASSLCKGKSKHEGLLILGLIFPPLTIINRHNAFTEITQYIKNLVFVEQMLGYYLPISNEMVEVRKMHSRLPKVARKHVVDEGGGTEPSDSKPNTLPLWQMCQESDGMG